MKGLLKKEVYTLNYLKKSILFVLFIFIAVGLLANQNVTSLPAMLIIMVVSFAANTFKMDETAHFDRYAIALPLSKKQVVLSRYLFASLFILANTALGFVLGMGLGLFAKAPALLPSVLGNTLALFLLSVLSVSTMFPAAYRFGVQKGQLVMLGTLLGIVGLGAAVFSFIKNRMPHFFDRPFTFTASKALLWAGISLVVCVLMLGLSLMLSINIFTKKDH